MADTFLRSSRMLAYGSLSSLAAAGVVVSALRSRSNFYSAAVMVGRSNGGMMVLFNFGAFVALLFSRFVQKIFFGPLRPIEVEHLYERMWYAFTESLIAFTIFRSEFDASFVLLFGSLLILKAFHWLTADRVEYMEQTPSVNAVFHARMVCVQGTLLLIDVLLVAFTVEMLLLENRRLGMMIMFTSEFAILLVNMLSTIGKYVINCIDSRSEEPWEGKSMLVFAIDLITDFLKLAIYLLFFLMILTYYGLPLNIVRDVYMTGRSLFSKIRDLIRYRAATKNMDDRYPSATRADMQAMSDGTCIICREEMVVAPPAAGSGADPSDPNAPPGSTFANGLNYTPKRLPCGHIFHFHCLRAWLERQQSCPTCRRTVFTNDAAGAAGAAAPGAAGPGQNAAPAAAPAPGQAPRASGQADRTGGAAAAAATPTPTAAASAGSASAPSARGVSASEADRRLQAFIRQHTAAWDAAASSAGSASAPAAPQPLRDPASLRAQGPPMPARVPAINGGQFAWTATGDAVDEGASSSSRLLPADGATRPADAAAQDAEELEDEDGQRGRAAITQDEMRKAREARLRRFQAAEGQPEGGDAGSSSTPSQGGRVSLTPLVQAPTMQRTSSLQDYMDSLAEHGDQELSPEQLENLSRLTRCGIEERLKVLHRIDQQIWTSVEELTRCLSMLPADDDASAVEDAPDRKGKHRAQESSEDL